MNEEHYLNKHARDALIVWRDGLASAQDGPGGTYLGGFPKLPPEQAWPCLSIDGEERGLSFAGQIDMEDVPPNYIHRQQLPQFGTLYFFYQDIWETGPGDNSVMPCSVIYHPASSRHYTSCSPPPLLVAPNESARARPHFLSETDYHRHGTFRFNSRLLQCKSYPDDLITENESLDFEEFDGARAKLDASNWRAALAGVAPARRGWNVDQVREEQLFAWGLIEYFARGVITPRRWEQSLDLEDTLQREAELWLSRACEQDFFAMPPIDVRADVAGWITSVPKRTSRNYRLWNDVLWHVVQMYSERRLLDRIPSSLLTLIDDRPSIEADAYERVSHLVLGHGSSNHTAVQPFERRDRLLLLKIDFADRIFAGSEGAMHFWIHPRDLARCDFGTVELTC